ncbi:DNA-directed DNA polymerase, family X, beta-lik [Cordyceps fumosorosea ARSEF 2679]|uniref:DNA polymerase n=1 Tax=Cordyceps fumosorosea (strain ARSEF 2679) TaxID=1081104 RepID=A0A167YDD3_CORFA|nr:DNA-directed DNA polymerase, family X, beta-lik [Cordyceps fumosorosea ARSEF 2679]OAA66201.1 DNA-directed DNA polymerase, family X, beta-lik [Cordyceps fumosorosea ARSEF 2679]
MTLPLPVIFLLQTHLTPAELHKLEEDIPTLTYDVNEAEVVLGRVSRKQRAQFELRRLKLETEPVETDATSDEPGQDAGFDGRQSKRQNAEALASTSESDSSVVKVVNLSWLTDSIQRGAIVPMSKYIVYEGKKRARSKSNANSRTGYGRAKVGSILGRAEGDKEESSTESTPRFKRKQKENPNTSNYPSAEPFARPGLIRQSTSEHDLPMPPIPNYLHTTYSCQRPTPINPPNAAFIAALKSIRTLRLLQGDKIGVRAYSTSISAIAAYPYKIQTPQEVSRLPGCGWRDLDDIVEYGWQALSRVQQIGVKYYDEFQQKIGREEVARIADIILDHARLLDQGYDMAIVGGYRRGREESGDVDVILTHREESKTIKLVEKLVLSLEKDKYITHTLSLSTRNSERGQAPLPWKGEGSSWSTGFDTLDKALVVWLDPKEAKAVHRRVDIIVSPWKTIGCAILGWSGETTFQRDLRRYCKKEKGLKFDSSGIRSREDGRWIDLERSDASASSMEEAERRVFEGLDIPWRPPCERCTG